MKKFFALLFVLGLCTPALMAQDKKADPAEQFKKMDKNSDGKISKEEFIGKRTGDKATKAEEGFKKKDKDGDGSLSMEEFAPKKKAK
ncbi:EF hand [Anatilimnocola aggregata]|uniref:EF hand n=1 Tax=Anatilimnocola aggregata TaxID=2528021 RepID=A0A517YGI2_9BACT|nr:EF-hand domain-containing protein [Anatilimnocola aggregata]QDU29337.1 EF hand [Anatilimnocola aggregata]